MVSGISTYGKKTLPARLDRPLQLKISQHMCFEAAYVEMPTATEGNGLNMLWPDLPADMVT